MTPRTEDQNKIFHALIGQHKIDKEDKAQLVSIHTGGRTTSSAAMSQAEMAKAIKRLEAGNEASIKKMRAKVYCIARDIFGMKTDDKWEQKHYDAVDTFMRRTFKNPLRHVPQWQLPDAVTAMEAWRKTTTQAMVNNILNNI